MSKPGTLTKREILNKIIAAGINITPHALNILSNANLNNKDIEDLIREISYQQNFRSHITFENLKLTKLSSQYKLDNIPKSNIEEFLGKLTESGVDNQKKVNEKKNENNLTNENRIDNKLIKNNTIDLNPNQEENPNTLPPQPVQSPPKPIAKSSELDSLEELENVLSSELNLNESQGVVVNESDNPSDYNEGSLQTNIDMDPELSDLDEADQIARRLLSEEGYEPEIVQKTQSPPPPVIPPQLKNLKINTPKEDVKKVSLKIERFKGISNFHPIAKEYYDNIKVLSDPTKFMYTDGSIDDLFGLLNDRFERLKSIIKKNQDAQDCIPIKQILNMPNNGNVKFIGMVKEKKLIGSSNHIKITFDDPTGEIDVLIRNTEQNLDLYNKMIYLLEDHVVLVHGYYQIDPKRKSKIIFANDIEWPDIQMAKRPPIPNMAVSICLISDVHIGSMNFLPKLFDRFIQFIRGEIGSQKIQEQAGQIKYLIINGDLVDGIGVYPKQDKELNIPDIYKQYEAAANYLSKIPDYIKIIYIPGNHEPVRNALPHPAISKKYCQPLLDLGVINLGNPSFVCLDGLNTLIFHGDSLIDMNTTIPGLKNERPELAMKEYLRSRHLAPTYGRKTEIAPIPRDWLVIEEEPHLFHTGHVHCNGRDYYNGVLMVNSGCFQSQTEYMKSFGINPTPGFPIIVEPRDGKINSTIIDLNE